MEISRNIAVLDYHMAIDIDPAKIFIPEIVAAFTVIVAFLLIVLSKTPEKLTNAVNDIMRSDRYVYKEGNMWCPGPAHICASLMALMRMAVNIFIVLNSSVLVVPISKKLVQLMDCEHPENGPAFLFADPSITCWGSQHIVFLRMLAVLWPLYILT